MLLLSNLTFMPRWANSYRSGGVPQVIRIQIQNSKLRSIKFSVYLFSIDLSEQKFIEIR